MKLAFLGVGNMAGAILGAVSGIVADTDIVLYDRVASATDRYADRAYSVAPSAPAAVAAADCVIFAVKPQNIPELLAELKAADVKPRLIVSIAAGITIKTYTDAFGDLPVVRTMPNTPMLIGRGVIALCRNALVDDTAFAAVRAMFDAAGSTLVLDEADMNKIIAVTGSSPAYVFRFIRDLYANGVAQGLPAEGLLDAACDAVIGSAMLLRSSDKTPDELIAMVTSKGGTTAEALRVLDEYRFDEGLAAAMQACTDRADALGRA